MLGSWLGVDLVIRSLGVACEGAGCIELRAQWQTGCVRCCSVQSSVILGSSTIDFVCEIGWGFMVHRKVPQGGAYHRTLLCCSNCGTYSAAHLVCD